MSEEIELNNGNGTADVNVESGEYLVSVVYNEDGCTVYYTLNVNYGE